MELRHLRYFVAVAEELNFTRAAVRVGIGQPPLSQQIRALENHIGTPLFVRTPHGAELTDAGTALLPEARMLLAHADRALELARRGGRGEVGRLRVGFTASAAFVAAFPDVLRAFSLAYPDVALELTEAATAPLLAGLREHRFDVALIRVATSLPPDLGLVDLLQEPMVVAVPASHRLADASSTPLSLLSGDPLILFPREAGPDLFDDLVGACRTAGYEARLGPVAPQFATALNLVAAGLGIALVPASLTRVRNDAVRYLTPSGAQTTIRLSLATPGTPSSIARNFVALARAHFGAPESGDGHVGD